jgi:hypothetical protein
VTSTVQDQCREALHLVEDALKKPPAELKAEVDVAERTIAGLRDALIGDVRAAPRAELRVALDNVNTALSAVVGIEYPVGGLQRELLEQARTALQAALPHLGSDA